MSQRSARQEAEYRYAEIRQAVRAMVEPDVQELTRLPIKLADITLEAVEIADGWHPTYANSDRTPGWSWRSEYLRFRRRPRRVELALWHGETLCGLALGRISDRCVVATIHLIESNPSDDNPLDSLVAAIVSRFLETLGVRLGCTEVSIEAPVPALLDHYRSLGFTREVSKGKRVIRLKKRLAG